jgi:heptosyltransferase II
MNEKILIIGPTWVGDMVMAQSLFKLLRMSRTNVEIDVLAPAWSLPLLARMPEVASSIIMPIGHGELKLAERYRIAKELRNKQYTQAIVLPGSFKSALIPFLAKVPLRTGWLGEMRWGLLNDARRLDKVKYPLMVERYLALGLSPSARLPDKYPIPKLEVTAVSQDKAITKHHLKLGSQPVLALCPGAEFGPAKRWPEEYYAELANAKLKEGWAVWLMGSPKDATVTATIMALTSNRCVDLAGKTSLEEAVDLLSLTTLVVSNDSGLMHIASALHKPLIGIYGPTSASFTPPLQEKAKVLSLSLSCQPCFGRECPLKHQKCMRDLLPDTVLQAMSTLVKDSL